MKPLRCTACGEWREPVFEACACGIPALAPRARIVSRDRAETGEVGALLSFDPIVANAEKYKRQGLRRWYPVDTTPRGRTLDMFPNPRPR